MITTLFVRNYLRWPLTEWGLMAASVPFLLFPSSWSWLALPLVASAWLIRRRAIGRWRLSTLVDPWIFLILLGAIVGVIISVDLPLSLNRATVLLLGWLLYETTTVTAAHRHLDRHWLTALAGVSLAIAVAGFVMTDWQAGVLLPLPWIYEHLPQIDLGIPGSGVPHSGGLFNPRVVAGAAVLLAPLNIMLARAHSNIPRWQRGLHGLAALMLLAYLMLSQSPQGITGLLAALLILIWWHLGPKGRQILLGAGLGISLTGVALAWKYHRTMVSLLISRPGFGLEARLELWTRALRMIQTAPLSGIGLNNYAPIFDVFYPGYLLGPEAHAHNTLLQTATDSGTLALIGLLLWLVSLFWLGIQTLRRTTDHLESTIIVAALAALAGWFIYGLLDSATLGHKVGVAVWVLSGMVVGLAYAQGFARPRKWMWGAMIGLLISAGALAGFSGYGIDNLATVLAQQRILRPHASLADANTSLIWLQAAEDHIGGRPHLYRLRALLQLQQGDDVSAADSFRHLVALESEEPLWVWAPAAILRGELTHAPPGSPDHAKSLEKIYQHWFYRYPDRVEPVALLTFLYADILNDTHRAKKFLNDVAREKRSPQRFVDVLFEAIEYPSK